MDAQNLTLGLAFIAGLLSFASPCVLPLVPAYIGYLGGTAVISATGSGSPRPTARIFFHSLLFVLGFMAVFVLLGASASLIGRLLFDYSILLQRVGGVMLVVFGMRLMSPGWSRGRWVGAAILVALLTAILASGLLIQGRIETGPYLTNWVADSIMMGLVVLAGAGWTVSQQIILALGAGALNFLASFDDLVPRLVASALITLITIFLNRAEFFYAEVKLDLKQADPAQTTGSSPTRGLPGGDYLRSLLFGVVFAAGWTPCVGPILAGILVVASQLQTVGQGILLLVAYSLGLGIPFLVVGLAFGPLSRSLRRMNRYLGIISIVSGVLLVLMGIVIFTDSLTFLAQYGTFFQLEY